MSRKLVRDLDGSPAFYIEDATSPPPRQATAPAARPLRTTQAGTPAKQGLRLLKFNGEAYQEIPTKNTLDAVVQRRKELGLMG
jgi:hypothetical protein